MSCKLGILKGECKTDKLVCKFYRGDRSQEPCILYEFLNDKYMSDREISTFNIFLGGILKKG